MSWARFAGEAGRILLLQGDRGPQVAGAADSIAGAGGLRGAVELQEQSIRLQTQLQPIARIEPQQLAQPSRNHQLPFG